MNETLIQEWTASRQADHKIAAYFASKIASGQLTSWSEFPDNTETARTYDVSIRTVIRAKQLLMLQGAAKKVAGVYVVA
jgi:DNA-binding GntR family transcriptional regulator